MAAIEQKARRNISRWRQLSKQERQSIAYASVAERAANSMAMEGEPVSEKCQKKYAR